MKTENRQNFIKREELLKELEFEFVSELIKIRKEKKLSQQKLADSADVIRETIARIENLITSPQLNTLIKILEPMGYTVKIVPLQKK